MSDLYQSPEGNVFEVTSPVEAVNLVARGYRLVEKPRPAKTTTTEKKEK